MRRVATLVAIAVLAILVRTQLIADLAAYVMEQRSAKAPRFSPAHVK